MTSPDYPWTTQTLAASLGINDKTLLRKIRHLDVGISDGRGFRFSDADRARVVESMRRTPAPTQRRRRRAA